MSQGRHSTRLLLAAITALLTGSLVGSSDLVLCIGADGHRALEREHDATGCPTLAGSQPELHVSMATPGVCFDLPATGGSPMAPSSAEGERLPTPPAPLLATPLEPPTRIETPLPASTDARAGPPSLALHLPSTVLLV